MADTRSVRPLGLIRELSIVVGGHLFEISVVVLSLESPGAYPLLLGRPWLRSANIKQNWQHNNLSFRRGRAKVRVPMEEGALTPKEISPLYAEEIHMLEGLEDEELERYLDENPRIVPLFEIDVAGTADSYASPSANTGQDDEPGEEALAELQRAQEAFEREMEISRRVAATELEEVNMGTTAEPRTLSIAKNLPPSTRTELIELLGEYKDVFAWSYEDMKGLDPKFYQHQINLATDAKPVQQRRYRMNGQPSLEKKSFSPPLPLSSILSASLYVCVCTLSQHHPWIWRLKLRPPSRKKCLSSFLNVC